MEPNRMYTGLSQAAWGYFFITFDFNLNHVSILPRFVGYILLYLAVDKLSQARRDLNLLRPLAVVLICWFFGDWFFTAAGWNLEGRVPFLQFLSLVVSVCVLYFHFQFLTDMAALAEGLQPADGQHAAAHRCLPAGQRGPAVPLGLVGWSYGLCGRDRPDCGADGYDGPVPSAPPGAKAGDRAPMTLAFSSCPVVK